MEKIPTPPGLPFVGNTYDVDYVQQTASLEGLAKTYGPTYEVRLMQGSYVVCSDFELFDELCDEKRFTKHPAGGLGELRHGLGDGLFTAKYGEHNWEIAHRVLVPSFGPLAISKMFDEMHGIASQLVLKWARHGPECRINSTDDFTKLTLDTIALCSMGTRFNSFYRDEVHPFAQSMTKVMLESGKRGSRAKIMNFLMKDSANEFFDNIHIMKSICQAIIDDRRTNPSDKNDLVNAMLHRKDPKTGEMMSDANIINNMITFLVAGHETTSGFLAFLFYEFMKNPVELRKAQKEIDDVVGTGRVRHEHMTKLPFLTACLREAIRLHPPAAATYMTTNPDNQDDPVSLCGGKYHVRKGTTFRNLIRLIQTDPAIYGSDATVFRPERMLDENFNKLPRNAWKPFGNGSRACIGRDFAWQEAMLVTTMLLQSFDFRLDDPQYDLQIQQTLTVKPKNMFFHATPRKGLSPIAIENRLYAADSSRSHFPHDSEPLTSRMDESHKPMAVFFGGNMGTCESLAQTVGNAASGHGFKVQARPLDDAVNNVPNNQPVLIITSSYEGQPPDNACKFIEWIEKADGETLSGVSYAVFGCGNRHWKDTYQRIPKISDCRLEQAGARRLVDRGAADVSNNTIFDDFEKWQDEKFWPNVKASFGGEDDPASDCVSALDIAISDAAKPHGSCHGAQETLVLKSKTAALSKGSRKRHFELQLPAHMKYKAGDYLAVLPENPRQNVERVFHKFDLPWDGSIYIKSKHSFLPHGTPLGIRELLGSYVELGQPATRRNIKTLMHHTSDSATRMSLKSLGGNYFPSYITAKNTNVLDLLEAYPAIHLPFETYIAMLPSLRPRQYSISSSPLTDPGVCSITYSVLDSPSFANQSRRFLGVSTNHLASLRPGDHVLTTVQSSAPGFHMPEGSRMSAPMIMFCAGTGIAPFRGFVQERAVLMTRGTKVGPALLYIGYRDEKIDRLYVDELEAWAQMGAVDVRWACSRPGKGAVGKQGGMYVQDRLWDDRDEIRGLMEQDAMIYVCGSRAVADGVEGALKKLRMEWQGGCCGVEEAEKWFNESKGRTYVADVFD